MALTFALAIVPLVLATGVGIDVSRIAGARGQLQDATDAAGLALAHFPAGTDVDSVVKPAAQHWITANLHGTTIDPNAVTVSVTPQDNGVIVTASTLVQPTLAAIVHLGPFAVQSTSTIKFDVSEVEVAMVLDNTYSMSVPLDGAQTKIDVLKQASKDLINTLMTDANTKSGGVKLGIVPYAEYVNVGMSNRSKTWLNVPADSSNTTHHDATGAKKTCDTKTTTQCTGGVWNSKCSTTTTYKDGIPTTTNNGCWTSPQTCTTTTNSVKPYECGNYVAAYDSTSTSKWFGCVKHNVTSLPLLQLELPDAVSHPVYDGIMESSSQSQKCLKELLPLTSSRDTALTTIDGLIVSRPGYTPETYIPSGLVWGVNVLSSSDPFSEGAPYDPNNIKPRKALILMTDGNNTRALTVAGANKGLVGAGTAPQIAATYNDQQRVCAYAKSKGVEVYTVGFGVTDAATLSALQSCSSGDGYYFPATSSADMLKAFQVIAGQLTKLRISQ